MYLWWGVGVGVEVGGVGSGGVGGGWRGGGGGGGGVCVWVCVCVGVCVWVYTGSSVKGDMPRRPPVLECCFCFRGFFPQAVKPFRCNNQEFVEISVTLQTIMRTCSKMCPPDTLLFHSEFKFRNDSRSPE